MSRGRRALLTKLLNQRKRGQRVYVFFKNRGAVPPEFGGLVSLGCPRGARPPSQEQVDEVVRAHLAAWVSEEAKRPKPPSPPPAPKALGNEARTLAARRAVEAAAKPAVVGTRLARCLKCRQQFEAPATENATAICPSCGTGGA